MEFSEIRDEIILKNGIKYFDFTASGLAAKCVESEIARILPTYANTHSEVANNAKITTKYYENANFGLKRLLNLSDDFHLLPCGFGSTAAIKRFQEIMGIYIPPMSRKRLNLDISSVKNRPLVVISPYEHHSNELSFRAGICDLHRVRLKNGRIDFDELNSLLKSSQNRQIIGSFSAASNVTGVISDYKKLYEIFHEFGGILALDASSLIAHDDLDCRYFDALFLSPHKLLGGIGGAGILAIKKSLCECDEPTFPSGGTVEYANEKTALFRQNFEERETAGTPPILQLIRSFLAFDLRAKIGIERIKKAENELKNYFFEQILQIPEITLYAKEITERLPIFSFNIGGISPFLVSEILSRNFLIETRPGCACAGPYAHDLMDLGDFQISPNSPKKPGFVRVSLHFTHTKSDVDYLISALKSVAKNRANLALDDDCDCLK